MGRNPLVIIVEHVDGKKSYKNRLRIHNGFTTNRGHLCKIEKQYYYLKKYKINKHHCEFAGFPLSDRVQLKLSRFSPLALVSFLVIAFTKRSFFPRNVAFYLLMSCDSNAKNVSSFYFCEMLLKLID